MEWVIFIVRDHSFITGDGVEGGGEGVRGFLGRSHGFSSEQRSQSVFNRGQRGDCGKLIANKGGGGSVIRLLQSLFQSLIGSLGISYCGTNKTPPPPLGTCEASPKSSAIRWFYSHSFVSFSLVSAISGRS